MPYARYQKILDGFPNQFGQGLELSDDLALTPASHDRVFVCGMGGSTLGASLFNTYLDLRPDIKVHRSYGLPNDVTPKSLVVAISYSGDTAETLSAAEQALKQGVAMIIVTSGGELARLAEQNGIQMVKLPDGIPPRLTLGLQFSVLHNILAKKGLIENDPEALIEAAAEIAQDDTIKTKGQEIADQIHDRQVLIYTSNRLGAIARNWKIKLNETAKRAAFWNVLPEANHNELNAFVDHGDRFHLIMIKDKNDPEDVIKRMELTRHYAREQGLTVSLGEAKGSSFLARLLHTAWLGDWTALALARNHGVDPWPVPLIERLKKDLI